MGQLIKNKHLKIKTNKLIANNIYEMTLVGDDFTSCQFGQFVNIKVENSFLRKPFSICEFTNKKLVITYKVIGLGTKKLASYQAGELIDVIYPLGTGFTLPPEGCKNILLIGGGIGTPPLVGFSKYLSSLNKYQIQTVCGFYDQQQLIYANKLPNFTAVYDINNENVLTYINNKQLEFDYYYACGPMGMLQALANTYNEGQLLLEAKMGCGFGACMGCSIKTKTNDYKRVCVEGPMFYASEVKNA